MGMDVMPTFKPAPRAAKTPSPPNQLGASLSSSKLAVDLSDDDGGAEWGGEDDDLSLSD